MNITIEEYQNYLADKYKEWGTTEGLFIKLIEEVGELAEVINTRNGSKAGIGTTSGSDYEVPGLLTKLWRLAL